MTSLVNPSNINGNFPIAGQDNDSQGFRDNFTNIKNNFTFIKNEVEDLQSKAVLKSALTGTTLNNDFQGAKVKNLQVSNLTETMYDWGNFPGGNLQLDLGLGTIHKIYAASAVTPITINSTIKNWPASLQYARVLLYVTIPDVGATIKLPTEWSTDLSGIAGLRRDSGVPTIHFVNPGDYIYELSSVDSGVTVYMRDLTNGNPVFRDPNFYTLGIGAGKKTDEVDGYQSPTLILGFGDYLGAGNNATTGISYLIDDLKTFNDTLLVKGSISSYQRAKLSTTPGFDDGDPQTAGFDSLQSAGFSVVMDRSYATDDLHRNGVTLGEVLDGDLIGYYNAIGVTRTNNTLGLVQLGSIEFVATGDFTATDGIGGNVTIKVKGDGTEGLQNAMTIDSNKKVTIYGDLDVQGATTTIESTTLVVEDKSVVINNGGTEGGSTGSGIFVYNEPSLSATLPQANISIYNGQWITNRQFIFANSTASTSTSTGAVVVNGGVGVLGDIYGGANLVLTTGAVAPTIYGATQFTNATESTSTSTGAVKVSGGLAVVKNVYAGANINVTTGATIPTVYGITTLSDATDASSTTVAAVKVSGGLGVAKNIYAGANVNVTTGATIPTLYGATAFNNATEATGTTAASVTMAGGLGIAKVLQVAGNVVAASTTESTGTSVGSIVSLGGVGIAKVLQVAGNVVAASTTDSTTTSTGSIVTLGGIGAAKAVIAGGNILTTSTTDTTSTTGGALVSLGGLGVAKATYIGGNLTVTSNAQITGNTYIRGNLLMAANVGLAAGTTTIAPLNFAATGSVLTTPLAGAVEFDGVSYYTTTDTTTGRGRVPTEQVFKLTAAGTGITATSTGTNYFGATSNIPLAASGYYEIEIVAYFAKTTATTAVWYLAFTGAAPTAYNVYYEMSPITGIVAPPGTATQLIGQAYNQTTQTYSITTGTLTTGVNHYARIKLWVQNSVSATGLQVQVYNGTAGTITPGLGSYWKSTRFPTTNNSTYIA